ncbi:hypothetical protein R1sor_024296 [Riccia sorocarpa]|uniref:tRNA-uridine aminocarboxypropyltransferase n=1 Tax=Riccia sorocarpa TaxID=122646 RepID=A0ABD3GTC9_9MARC
MPLEGNAYALASHIPARMLSSASPPFHGAVVLRAMGGRRFPTISLQKDFVAHCDRASVLFFCKHYPLPPRVRRNMEKIKDLETEFGEELKFGGARESLKRRPGAEEDHPHREFYETLNDSEAKLQEFTARQVACRVIGSTGYLCETCWLPERDCMCECFDKGKLWPGICIWIYMHPKNNTGKLLWQVFGHKAARLTLYGIPEQEEIMWNAFREAGSEKVWCIYPHPPEFGVPDVKIPEDLPSEQEDDKSEDAHRIHIVLIDGTWSNSKAMISRLRERATSLWEGRSIPCVALSPTDVSPMHNLWYVQLGL